LLEIKDLEKDLEKNLEHVLIEKAGQLFKDML